MKRWVLGYMFYALLILAVEVAAMEVLKAAKQSSDTVGAIVFAVCAVAVIVPVFCDLFKKGKEDCKRDIIEIDLLKPYYKKMLEGK